MHLQYGGSHALVQPEYQIHLELFTLVLDQELPTIQLNLEHSDYQWIELSQVRYLKSVLIPLFIEGLAICKLKI